MIVALKTDEPEAVIVLLDTSGRTIATHSWQAQRTLARDLLSVLNEQLTAHSASLETISGLIYFKGPGSFTGLRIGASVANAIAYGNNIPIVGTSGDDWLRDGMRRLGSGNYDELVLPAYGREAHITQPRK